MAHNKHRARTAQIGIWLQSNGFNRFHMYDLMLRQDGSVTVWFLYRLDKAAVQRLQDAYVYRGFAPAHTWVDESGVERKTWAYRFNVFHHDGVGRGRSPASRVQSRRD